jgi:hypothetical protein
MDTYSPVAWCPWPASPVPVDVHHFQLSVSRGLLYEQLMDATGLDRPTAKRRFMADVLGKRGSYRSSVEDAFRRRYPSVHHFVRFVNRADHATLLRQLQRAESDFVIGGVGQRLAGTRGAYVSLHDGIFCRQADLSEVVEAIEDEMAAAGCRFELAITNLAG